jgi:uncharacterized protein with GYD domain
MAIPVNIGPVATCQKGATMATYITLYKFTDQGIRNVKDSPRRLQEAIKGGEALGMKILGAYYTVGEYDLVVLSEAADEKVAIAHTLSISGRGNVRSTTMKAFTPAEFQEILTQIP